MPQYMLSVHHDGTEDFDSIPRRSCSECCADVDVFNDEVRAAGKWVFAGGLDPIEATTLVDGTGESSVITDGPFSESKEYLGGFWVITAADLDEALEWAARGSKACRGKVGCARSSRPPAGAAVDGRRAGLPRRVRPGCRRAGPPVRRHRHRRGRNGRRTGHRSRALATRRRTCSNPAGWLTRVAGDKAIDRLRRENVRDRSPPRLPCSTTTRPPSQPAQSRTTGSD